MSTELKKIVASLESIQNGDANADSLIELRPRIDALRVKAINPSGFYGPQTILKIHDALCRYNQLLEVFIVRCDPLPTEGFDLVVDEKIAAQMRKMNTPSAGDQIEITEEARQKQEELRRKRLSEDASSSGEKKARHAGAPVGKEPAGGAELVSRARDDVEMLDGSRGSSSEKPPQREFIRRVKDI